MHHARRIRLVIHPEPVDLERVRARSRDRNVREHGVRARRSSSRAVERLRDCCGGPPEKVERVDDDFLVGVEELDLEEVVFGCVADYDERWVEDCLALDLGRWLDCDGGDHVDLSIYVVVVSVLSAFTAVICEKRLYSCRYIFRIGTGRVLFL